MISDKQKKILAFPYTNYDALICDGAIRSGKTSIMTVAFIDWAMREFSGVRFGICGKTVDSAVKNIIMPYIAMQYVRKKYIVRWRRSDKVLEVARGAARNFFEIFGGKDESSFTLIQGRTLAGVLMDEVALMPRSFVEQALARCSVEGARLWFSCNPESPQHWFYNEWIKRHKERNALYLRFRMEDNPSLSEKTLNRYKSIYSGVFYQRYIEGLWVVAEGLVYSLPQSAVTDDIPADGEYYISCDYGTMNPFSAGLWCVSDGKAVRISEFYYDGRANNHQLTDGEYYDKLCELAGGYDIRSVIIDPSAASFIALIRKNGLFKVRKADNEVINGIRRTQSFIKNGNILIHRNCKDAIREFGLYRWDEKSAEDKVIKENDHAMDDIRYFCNTILVKKLKNLEYTSIL